MKKTRFSLLWLNAAIFACTLVHGTTAFATDHAQAQNERPLTAESIPYFTPVRMSANSKSLLADCDTLTGSTFLQQYKDFASQPDCHLERKHRHIVQLAWQALDAVEAFYEREPADPKRCARMLHTRASLLLAHDIFPQNMETRAVQHPFIGSLVNDMGRALSDEGTQQSASIQAHHNIYIGMLYMKKADMINDELSDLSDVLSDNRIQTLQKKCAKYLKRSAKAFGHAADIHNKKNTTATAKLLFAEVVLHKGATIKDHTEQQAGDRALKYLDEGLNLQKCQRRAPRDRARPPAPVPFFEKYGRPTSMNKRKMAYNLHARSQQLNTATHHIGGTPLRPDAEDGSPALEQNQGNLVPFIEAADPAPFQNLDQGAPEDTNQQDTSDDTSQEDTFGNAPLHTDQTADTVLPLPQAPSEATHSSWAGHASVQGQAAVALHNEEHEADHTPVASDSLRSFEGDRSPDANLPLDFLGGTDTEGDISEVLSPLTSTRSPNLFEVYEISSAMEDQEVENTGYFAEEHVGTGTPAPSPTLSPTTQAHLLNAPEFDFSLPSQESFSTDAEERDLEFLAANDAPQEVISNAQAEEILNKIYDDLRKTHDLIYVRQIREKLSSPYADMDSKEIRKILERNNRPVTKAKIRDCSFSKQPTEYQIRCVQEAYTALKKASKRVSANSLCDALKKQDIHTTRQYVKKILPQAGVSLDAEPCIVEQRECVQEVYQELTNDPSRVCTLRAIAKTVRERGVPIGETTVEKILAHLGLEPDRPGKGRGPRASSARDGHESSVNSSKRIAPTPSTASKRKRARQLDTDDTGCRPPQRKRTRRDDSDEERFVPKRPAHRPALSRTAR